MKRKLILMLTGAMLAAASGMATARDHISFSLFIGAPGYAYVPPPPVYYVPPPTRYYVPPAVYYVPPPVAYYAPPRVVYYHPAPGVRVYGKHHKAWRRHAWR